MYSLMTVADLKAELKKRNACLTGKKADLVTRLESYDKNFGINNEGTAEYLEIEDSMLVPPDELYKDVNASTKLPPFTRHHIQSFNQSHPFLGASPDGLLNDEYTIEVKCPYSANYQDINTTNIPYLECINGELSLKKNHPYYTQVQGQLFCTKRLYCLFIVYTIKDLKVIYVEKNCEFINDMLEKLSNFYNSCFKGMILEKYLYKNYNIIEKK